MAAMAHRELALRQVVHTFQIPPVHQLQGKPGRAAGEAGLGVQLGKGRFDRGDIAAVAVQKQDLLETMPGQRAHPIANRGDKGGRAQGNGAGKAQVMLGHADVEGGADQQVGVLLRLMGDDFRAHPVGAQQAGRAVLFVGTDGNDHRAAAFQKLPDLDPGGVV